MAVAPVNKFLTVAVPAAPGLQKLYEVPTGTSAILLYAQVSNVGVGTYPTATLIHRRESRSTGNQRDIRVIKDIEIPPNDAAILIDGRLVLEKTATTLDRLYLKVKQTGIGTILNVTYNEPIGVATVTTMDAHGFSLGQEITMAGIAFTCPSGSGITTTIFPDPQQSFTVDSIIGDVGTSRTFTSFIGSAAGINHTFSPAIHYFVRADANAVTDGSSNTYTPQTASYSGASGNLTITVPSHGLTTSDTVSIATSSIYFTCTSDGNDAVIGYPRATDPIAGISTDITATTTDTFTVFIGTSPSGGYVAPLQMEFLASILENTTT